MIFRGLNIEAVTSKTGLVHRAAGASLVSSQQLGLGFRRASALQAAFCGLASQKSLFASGGSESESMPFRSRTLEALSHRHLHQASNPQIIRSLSTQQNKAMVYPKIEPYEKGTLKVSDIHTLYYEISGNKDGTPVVFVHGGPGGGTDPQDRSFFNPHKYKIILFDQRGAGKSTPTASLEENTTWDLVKDIERLREKLAIEKWHVFGGSWGSTLSLAYAQSHPDRVKSLVLRGIFTLRRSELEFFYQNGASHLFPEAWEEYVEPIPEAERHDMVLAYHAQLNSVDEATRIRAAKAWTKWEMATSRLYVDPKYIAEAEKDDFANAFARIENHYFVNSGFMRDGQLLEVQEIDKIRKIPAVIVQGRYDVVCPATTAYALHKVWPEAEFHIVPDAGHSSREDGTSKLLVQATDKFADL